MDDSAFSTRRRVLGLTGATALASVAGCTTFDRSSPGGASNGTDGGDGRQSESEGGAGGDAIDVPETALTAAVEPDQDELQELEEDLTQRLEEGEIDQEEASRTYRRRQGELVIGATESFEEDVDGDDDLTVEGSIPESGIVLVDGEAATMRRLLNDGPIHALLTGETFATAHRRQQQVAEATGGENDTARTTGTDGDAPENRSPGGIGDDTGDGSDDTDS